MSANISNSTAELAVEINEAHEAAMQHAGAAIEYALRVGRLLVDAKARVPHGKWMPWLRANIAFSERTAQAYMRIAQRVPLEIRNGAADFSVRAALRYVARPRRVSIDDDLAAWLEKSPKFECVTLDDALAYADHIREFDMIMHRYGICSEHECCTICGDAGGAS